MTCKPASVWRRLWPVFLSAVIVALIVACNGDDPPVGPEPAKDYVVYFNDGGFDDRYFRYHTGLNTVDTFTVPYASYDGLKISADGMWLYLANEEKTMVLSTDSLGIIAQLDYQSEHGVAVSPDNNLAALQGDDGLFILNTADFSLVYHDTVVVHNGVFSADSKNFYAARLHEGVYVLELVGPTPAATTKSFPSFVWQVVPSQDQRKWLMLVRHPLYACHWWFEVYEPGPDSSTFRDSVFQYGYGDIVISPDGETAYYTMPGAPLFQCAGSPQSAFTVFNIEANAIDRIVSTDSIGVTSPFFPVGELAITPDGERLIAARGPVGGEFLVYDTKTMQLLDYFYLG
ncbi:hypothetical protein GF420_11025, partial [candidate division GN15 bacterium]|nr:hypothetical protein [candidate division GN15 bacterium]